eukprot:gene14725-20769_t
MMIIALVPIDVWATKEDLNTTAIGVLWDVAYWSTQAGTWLVLPFYQIYSEAGGFTIRAKTWTSIKENAILYGSVGALGLIGIVILLMTKTFSVDTLLGLGIFLSNAFGLIGGIVLLGYGLVEMPKTLWLSANPKTQLKWCVHRAGLYAEAVMRATAELEEVVTIVCANSKQIRRHDPLKKYMDKIEDYAEKESQVKPSQIRANKVDLEGLTAEDLEYNFDIHGLARLRRRLFAATAEYNGTQSKYVDVMVEAFELEDVIKCRQLREYTPRPPVVVERTEAALEAKDGGPLVAAAKATPAFSTEQNPLARPHRPWTKYLWMYKCVARPVVNKVFAVILGIVSLCIIWAEATIPFESNDLSPFSQLVLAAQHEFTVQLVVCLPLIYMCACSYLALFRINIEHSWFSYNKLIRRATTGASLMQNGSLMCRFAAPTCWNFYHIIRFTQESGQHTVFGTKMASMDITMTHVDLNLYLLYDRPSQHTVFGTKMASMDITMPHVDLDLYPLYNRPSQHTVFGTKMASMDITMPHVDLNLYLPIVLVVQCSLVALNLWRRLLNSCVSSKYKFSADDIDDEYTEKGRLLVGKEQEAQRMGYPIGQPSPTKPSLIKPSQPPGSASSTNPAASATGANNTVYKSPVAQAAAKWINRAPQSGEPGVNEGASEAEAEAGTSNAAEHPRTGLLDATGPSVRSTDSSAYGAAHKAPAAGRGGLDGLFASIGGPASVGRGAGAGGSASTAPRLVLGGSSAPASKALETASASAGTKRLILGGSTSSQASTPAAAASESSSLFGRWGLS